MALVQLQHSRSLGGSLEGDMAGQPTTPRATYPSPEIRVYGLVKPLFLGGDRLGGCWLISDDDANWEGEFFYLKRFLAGRAPKGSRSIFQASIFRGICC